METTTTSIDTSISHESDSDDEQLIEIYGETEFLEDVLTTMGSCAGGLTAAKMQVLDNQCLITYALLVVSLIGKYGSLEPDNEDFVELLDSFCDRAMSFRPLKLRAGILLSLTKLSMTEYWSEIVTYDPTCYDRNNAITEPRKSYATLRSINKEETNSSTTPTNGLRGSTTRNITADELLNDDKLFDEYVATRFFHPTNGITLKTKRRGVSTYKNAFSEYTGLLFLMSDLNIKEKTTASAIGARMEQRKLIVRKRANFHPTKSFGFGRDAFVRAVPSESNLQRRASVKALVTKQESNVGIDVTIGQDFIDMQSIDFWQTLVWEKPLVEGSDFGTFVVIHPMAVVSTAEEEDNFPRQSVGLDTGVEHGAYIVHNVEVKKVFSSMAKPGILSLSAYKPGEVLFPKEEAKKKEIEPMVIAKSGDNLFNDMSIELMFRVFNHVWKQDSDRFEGTDKVPFSFAYDVLPTGPKTGLLECVTGMKALNGYDWDTWVSENKENSEVLDTMLRSAAGCSVATYILGCGDRHWDNISIKDASILMHIDFGMILGENPAFKTPRFSISADQEKAFKAVGIWEPFVKLCGAAFLSLRARSSELTRVAELALHHAGKSQSKIMKFFASEASFNITEADDAVAEKYVCDQVRDSSSNWETILRKFTHNRVDPMFFRLAEAAPDSLVAAVERMYDK